MCVHFVFILTAASGGAFGMALAVEEEETIPLPVTCARGQVVQMQSEVVCL